MYVYVHIIIMSAFVDICTYISKALEIVLKNHNSSSVDARDQLKVCTCIVLLCTISCAFGIKLVRSYICIVLCMYVCLYICTYVVTHK